MLARSLHWYRWETVHWVHAQPYAMRKLMDFVGRLRWRAANPCCPRACLLSAPSAVHEWLITVVNLSYEVPSMIRP
eukprot:SAG31_NODE_5236_length_2658_cov_5.864009_2_plen_76_part_00